MKILIVEDSRSQLQILTQYVHRLGVAVVQAQSGAEGIEAFAREQPDIVLLAVRLADMDGFSVAQRLRSMETEGDWAPIIFFGTQPHDEEIEKGIAAGGDDFLLLPANEIVLGAKIRAMQRFAQMRTSLMVLARKLDKANDDLHRLSASDGLTGIANRRYFDEAIGREWRRARRMSASIALLVCDIDYFKLFNDTYGHLAGDDCLRRVAMTIQRFMERATDVAARFGGEEFVVLLPETNIGGALVIAERIMGGVADLALTHDASPFGKVSLSIGIASAIPGVDNPYDDLILSAKRALHHAKLEGRNRICRADAMPSH